MRELNCAVQMTIDRIIFLQICEDQRIEPCERLKNASGQTGVYAELTCIFQREDARYNSGLFHFKEEKYARSDADRLTLGLNLDDKVLREILGSLSYAECLYVFVEIRSVILGLVSERVLGKVIWLTGGDQMKVKEKPEVRKAGGVYCTPKYTADYIVKGAVGKLLEGESWPRYGGGGQVVSEGDGPDPAVYLTSNMTSKDVSRLGTFDPACGSATFPLGACQDLLDWHLKWWPEDRLVKSLKGKNPVLFKNGDGYRRVELVEKMG